MATSTTHYNLSKPAYGDAADIAVINGDLDSIDTALYNNSQAIANKVIRVPASGTMSVSSASSASNIATASDSRITSTMQCVHSLVGSIGKQTSDWTVTTSNGSVTVNGTCSSSTTLVLWLAEP